MSTSVTHESSISKPWEALVVTSRFNGETITSDAGGLLLRKAHRVVWSACHPV